MAFVRATVTGIAVLAALSAAANYGAGAWLKRQITAGAPFQAASLDTAGWPLSLGFDATDPTLRDGPRVLKMTAAEVRAPVWDPLSLRIRPTLPATFADGRFDLTLTGGVASGAVAFGYALPNLPVRRIEADLAKPVINFATAPDMPMKAEDAHWSFTRQASGDYDLVARLDTLDLPAGMADRIAPGADLGDQIGHIAAEATLGFLTPPSLRGAPPELDRVDIRALSADWGGRGLSVQGTLRADMSGLADGSLRLSTADWQSWYEVARRAGWLGRADHLVEALLRGMAASSADNSVTIPVTFAKGKMSVGPVPTGFVLRLR